MVLLGFWAQNPVHLTQFEPILGTTIVINETNIKNDCSVIVVELIVWLQSYRI